MAEKFIVDRNTGVSLSGDAELTEEEWGWLRDKICKKTGVSADGHVDRIHLDIEKLARMAFEYDILDRVSSPIEVEIMRWFERRSDSMATTQQISQYLDRPTSSVSRALGRLVKKGQLEKVQQGVYKER